VTLNIIQERKQIPEKRLEISLAYDYISKNRHNKSRLELRFRIIIIKDFQNLPGSFRQNMPLIIAIMQKAKLRDVVSNRPCKNLENSCQKLNPAKLV
jgi:hypothetical protein